MLFMKNLYFIKKDKKIYIISIYEYLQIVLHKITGPVIYNYLFKCVYPIINITSNIYLDYNEQCIYGLLFTNTLNIKKYKKLSTPIIFYILEKLINENIDKDKDFYTKIKFLKHITKREHEYLFNTDIQKVINPNSNNDWSLISTFSNKNYTNEEIIKLQSGYKLFSNILFENK